MARAFWTIWYLGYVLLWVHKHEENDMRMMRTDHYDRRAKY